jgi:hypothetical protein
MNFIKRIRLTFSYKPEVNYAATTSSPITINVKLLKDHSMNCRCGSISIPIGINGNRYQCIKCAKQLTGTSYNFGHIDINHEPSNTLPKDASQIMDMDFYDDSVNFLKSEERSRY